MSLVLAGVLPSYTGSVSTIGRLTRSGYVTHELSQRHHRKRLKAIFDVSSIPTLQQQLLKSPKLLTVLATSQCSCYFSSLYTSVLLHILTAHATSQSFYYFSVLLLPLLALTTSH